MKVILFVQDKCNCISYARIAYENIMLNHVFILCVSDVYWLINKQCEVIN